MTHASTTPRYRLYREHKLLILRFTTLLQYCGCLDFSDHKEIDAFHNAIHEFFLLLTGHVNYEETRIHELLRSRGSTLADTAEADHYQHQATESDVKAILMAIDQETNAVLKQEYGYQLYLRLRAFLEDLLIHFAYEECKIMPELQSLCTDEELREIDFISYRLMTPKQMVEMITVLNPVMSHYDKLVYFTDMHSCEPKKFAIAWPALKEFINPQTANDLEKKLNINYCS